MRIQARLIREKTAQVDLEVEESRKVPVSQRKLEQPFCRLGSEDPMEAKHRVREFSNTTIGQIIPDCPSREFVTRLGLLPGTLFSNTCSWSASNLPQGVLAQPPEGAFQQTSLEIETCFFERKKGKKMICSLLLISGFLIEGCD